MDCPRNIWGKQEEYLILDIRNTLTPSETTATIPDIQTTY
jgi:hypothetical protein